MADEQNTPSIQGKIRKNAGGKRLKESFISQDIGTIKEHVIWDWIIPGFKNVMSNTLHNCISEIFGGKPGQYNMYGGQNYGMGRPTGMVYQNMGSYQNYNKMSQGTPGTVPSENNFVFDDIELKSMEEAYSVIAKLDNDIEVDGKVSVARYYYHCGLGQIADANPLMSAWGWTSMANAMPRRMNNGTYVIIMPKAKPLQLLR